MCHLEFHTNICTLPIHWKTCSWSTLVQVIACCLTTPSHYLNQCWPIINEVQKHSFQGSSNGNYPDTSPCGGFHYHTIKITATFTRGQWVNSLSPEVCGWHFEYVNILRPRQNGRHFPDYISNACSWIKMYEYRLRFHWSVFLRVKLTIFQHWCI